MSDRYKGGRIKYIKLKNFMTYNSLTLVPGDGLNMIIGPNGSGKSSIICAICLGLAGKPTFTGRQLRLTEYIKHGCDSANILIHLDDPLSANKVLKISRKILLNGQSEFKLNGKPVKENQVEKEVGRFNIQVNNLCQFLPQEKVAEFSKMSSKQLLESMQQTVGDQNMQATYEKLVKLRDDYRKMEEDMVGRKKNLEKDKERNRRREPELNMYRNRQELLKRIKLFEEKREILEYRDYFAEWTKYSKEVKEAESKVGDFEGKEIATLQKDRLNLHSQQEKYKNTINSLNENIKSKNCDIANYIAEIANLDNKIYDVKEGFRNKIEERKNYERSKEELKTHIIALENECKRELARKQEIEMELKQNERVNQENMQELSRIDTEYEEFEYRCKEIQQEKNGRLAELNKLSNKENEKMELLKRFYPDTYKAKCWLDGNRHLFKKDILGPLMILINVTDSRNIKFFESHIASRDMVLFLCEDKEDCKKFVKILRVEKKLQINASCVATRPLSSYQCDSSDLRTYKFSSFLSDLFEASDTVKAFLCERYQVHKTPVGDEQTEHFFMNEGASQISSIPYIRFYTPNVSYLLRRSKYGNRNMSCNTMQISSKGLLSAFATSSENDKRELQQKIADADQKLEQLKAKKEKLLAGKKKLNDQLNLYRNKKQEFYNSKDKLEQLKHQIQQKRKRISEIEDDIRAFDPSTQKHQCIVKIEQYKDEQVAMFDKLHNSKKKVFQLLNKKCYVRFYEAACIEKQSLLENQIKEKERQLIQLKEELEAKRKLFKNSKASAEKQIEKVKRITGINLRQPNKKEISKRYPNLPNSVAEIDNELAKMRPHLECTMETDDMVVTDFEALQKQIKEDEIYVENIEKKLKDTHGIIQKNKQKWLQPLENLISIISSKFGSYFKKMGCAGEVCLNKSENEEDFDKYGLSIWVKYRDGAPLRELSQAHHSGGECSVATIIFILSLQELVEVPFRCVDEINQGMDPVNERMIFEYVSSSADNSAQYFLLTPKLLHDLPYSQNMNIHLIHNGVCLEWLKFDLESFLQRNDDTMQE